LQQLGVADPPLSGLLMIHEPAIFRLIVKSDLPSAQRFERWVFGDSLPTIRKPAPHSALQPAADQRLIPD
jgi:prophage antirepressor-like protein